MTSPSLRLSRRGFALGSMQAAAAAALSGARALAQPRGAPGEAAAAKTGRMRVMLRAEGLSDASLDFLKQIGADDALVYTYDLPGYREGMRLEAAAAREARRRIEARGLRFAAVVLDQKVLANFLLGRPGGEKDLDNFCRTVESMGRAGVPVLLYSLLVSRAIVGGLGRTLPGYYAKRGRGGAMLKSYDDDRARRITEEPAGRVSADQVWDRIERFQRRCVPVAEAAGVRLACHPADPPVAEYWGIHQVLISMAALQRFVRIVPSPCNGLLLCQGTIQEAGIDVLEYIRTFAPAGKLMHVELRGVRGRVPRYEETFMDDGDLDLWTVVRELAKVGYDGPLEVAHVPGLPRDADRAVINAWSVAYLNGLLAAHP